MAKGSDPLADFRADLAGATPETIDRMRHAVLNGTLHHRAARTASRPISRRAVLGSAAALTGVLSGAAITAVVTGTHVRQAGTPFAGGTPAGSGTPVTGGTEVASGRALELAAQHAATAAAVHVGPGQYVYRRIDESIIWSGDGPWGRQTVRLRMKSWQEAWFDPQGMLLVRLRGVSGIDPQPLTSADRAIAESAGLLTAPPQHYDGPYDNYAAEKAELAANGPSLERPTPEYLAALPTDPGALLAELRSAALEQIRTEKRLAGLETDLFVFNLATRLLESADRIMSGELHAALYRAVEKLPKVRQVPGEVKLGSRTGIAIFHEAPPGKEASEFVLDAGTFEFLGTRRNVGTARESWTLVTTSRIVGAVGATS